MRNKKKIAVISILAVAALLATGFGIAASAGEDNKGIIYVDENGGKYMMDGERIRYVPEEGEKTGAVIYITPMPDKNSGEEAENEMNQQ